MFKFNPAEYKNNIRKKIDESLINNQFKEEIIDLLKTKLGSKSNQFNSISKGIIDNDLNKISFCSKYNQNQTCDKNNKKALFYCRSNRTINDYLFQNFEIYKIIERVNTRSIRHYKNSSLFCCRSINDNLSQSLLAIPNENHIIILHYGDNSALKMEILFHRFMLKNQKKHSNKYKTIKEIEESSTKELTTDNKMDDEKLQFSQSYKIRNRRTLPFNRFNRSINEFAESNKTLNSYLTYEF
ncbi:34271_t:CDS:1 [Gigaspora margarita]|uniref:34271_t:CDS:1 n=1 Tax=Gigaspora margarita TaxID=4874 RepID=A0ABN7WQL2_GIGMA|nr:34271_t:CDS:1 [Gigaspora margarita]